MEKSQLLKLGFASDLYENEFKCTILSTKQSIMY